MQISNLGKKHQDWKINGENFRSNLLRLEAQLKSIIFFMKLEYDRLDLESVGIKQE